MAKLELPDYKQTTAIVANLNKSANCSDCYNYNWVLKVIEKFVEFAAAGKVRKTYSSGLTEEDSNTIGVFGIGDGTQNGKIRAVVSAYDKVMNPSAIVVAAPAGKVVAKAKTAVKVVGKLLTGNDTPTTEAEWTNGPEQSSGGTIADVIENYWWVGLLGGVGAYLYYRK